MKIGFVQLVVDPHRDGLNLFWTVIVFNGAVGSLVRVEVTAQMDDLLRIWEMKSREMSGPT